jgi:hypothetical protein
MRFGSIRCPECGARGRKSFVAPERTTFGGAPAPAFEQERVCLQCGAWLWVAGRDVMPAAPRLLALSAAAEIDIHVDAVLAGIAATEAFKRELTALTARHEEVARQLSGRLAPPGPERP